ncbi:MAG: hypothetical protein NUW21_10585 [Elusimicrobia bacterium]|nr:hypothetical protein [Elusimicrobiota bacterium]
MRGLLVPALAAALLALPAAARACAWPSPPRILPGAPGAFILAWTAPAAPLLADAPSRPPALTAYRDWARARTDVDPRSLLRRQLELYRRIGVVDGRMKLELVLSGGIGRILPMNCAEALLFAEHEARFPVETTATEFLAFILEKNADLKVYLISRGGKAGTAPSGDEVKEDLARDAAEGWTMAATLHNHPFMFDNPTGDIGGVLVPSGDARYGDVGAFKRWRAGSGMRSAWITNGFDSLRLDGRDIDALAGLQRP